MLVAEMGNRSLPVHMRARMPCVHGLVCHVEMVLVTLEPCMAIEEENPILSMVEQSIDSMEGRVKNIKSCFLLAKGLMD